MKPKLRWMIRRDLADVLRIERQSFTHPWSEQEFLETLRRRDCAAFIAERGQQVVGFVVYEVRPSRISLVNLAVDVSSRRTGVGSELVRHLKARLTQRRAREIAALVTERNLAAQLFLKHHGFVATAVLTRPDVASPAGRGDIYLMRYRCQGAPPPFIGRNRISNFLNVEA